MGYHFVSNNMGFVIQYEMLSYTLKRTAGFRIKFHFYRQSMPEICKC